MVGHKQNYRVVVLAGGVSAERQVSLASGASVVQALEEAGHRAILFDPLGRGLDQVDWDRFDGCFLSLHGGAGEDGRIQRDLAARGVRFTGSGAAASAAAMSKSAAKRLFRRSGVLTPKHVEIQKSAFQRGKLCEKIAADVGRLGYPLVLKPDSQGSSLGVELVHDTDELVELLPKSGRFGWPLIAEQYVCGREFTVTVLGRRPLPPLEIVAPGGIFDYDSKYSGNAAEYHAPTDLATITLEKLQSTAVAASAALDTAAMVRIDLILDRDGRPWVLELNTLPGMTRKSLAPEAARQIGWEMPDLCDWMLREAMC